MDFAGLDPLVMASLTAMYFVVVVFESKKIVFGHHRHLAN